MGKLYKFPKASIAHEAAYQKRVAPLMTRVVNSIPGGLGLPFIVFYVARVAGREDVRVVGAVMHPSIAIAVGKQVLAETKKRRDPDFNIRVFVYHRSGAGAEDAVFSFEEFLEVFGPKGR